MSSLESKSYTRRYINAKEAMAYVMYDSSKNFNINEFESRFVMDVLKIDLKWNGYIRTINAVWDIINDSFLGVLVDRTATRWGKFKPYLLMYAVPGTILTCIFWMFPLFFDKNPQNIMKIIMWLLLAMTRETVSTLREISETGLLANITPNPDDRVRLYTMAEVVSAIWESIPQILMGVLMDLVNSKKINISMDSVFISMGLFCSVAGGFLAVFLAIFSKERISTPTQKTNYVQGIKTIINNKPMFLIMLSEFMTGYPVAENEHNYYLDVLGSASLRNVVIIPGMPLSFVSYTFLSKVRHSFSVKSLWIFGQHLKDVITLGIFAIGSSRGIGADALYKNKAVMVALLMVRDIFYKGTLSINKILPREVLIDALDYCEWKNGFRSEGITLSTKSMLTKVTKNLYSSVYGIAMGRIGYDLSAGHGQQSDRVKFILFVMATLIPAVMALFASIPKFFYDLSGEKRQRMYEELALSRASNTHRRDESITDDVVE